VTAAALSEEDRLLLGRAERVFGPRDVKDVIPRIRAIVAPTGFPEGEALATNALRVLRSGRIPAQEERQALVRMICAMRPAILTRRGNIGPLPRYFEFPALQYERWTAFQTAARPIIYSVGRLDRAGGDGVGTGFLVAGDLLVTNSHVVQALFGGFTFVAGAATVRFQMEYYNADGENPVPVTDLVRRHPTLDMALLRLGAHPPRPALAISATPLVPGVPVAAIGYPSRDSERNPVFADRVFGDIYDVKRASPGEIIQLQDSCLDHDCTTLGGSSGSPLVSQGTGEVVGVHFDSYYLDRNVAVGGAALREFVSPFLS
jgi:trypsin-like peptidase